MINTGRIEWLLCLWTNFLLYIGCSEPQQDKKTLNKRFLRLCPPSVGYGDLDQF